ncbi:MAG: N-acetylneuraminate synthase family protein [Methylococcaceae bacterium]|nr:N-acetylneuraminate synthase family protein [Methylococcaceae bacterium]MDZ4158091.1 N-acetylneuraminate synthase family protein [Methylococcales bacterium]MDP2392882.1 N-acetylneuraminate synthase family protein [Methylococcaceae bacterium]MDP3020410.1 N-acetylneuraminate synthase family protein [Methylococcaceae bacterium]MDP3390895.1 N-acetylneuraminate synthase family protein [Methylococcaceae bacterium]
MLNQIRPFQIAGRSIGPNDPPYCIAEVGINHNGDLAIAKRMIEEAKEAGADAVKFQTFKAEEFCGDPNQTFTYQSQGKTVTESMLAMFLRYEFPPENWRAIKAYCEVVGITFFSTPQNISDLELLRDIGVPVIKVGSDDFTNLPLLRSYVESHLPLILSCGMSDLAEVHQALDAVGWFDGYPVALLLCTSQYPTPAEDVNINKLTTLQQAFPGLLVGFSDHTQGALAAALAVSRGARIFEKHFTLDKNMPGPDHWFSEESKGLSEWIYSIRKADIMLGSPFIRPTEAEQAMKCVARRSLVALCDISIGEILNSQNIGLRRPGDGLPPVMYDKIIGLVSARVIRRGETLSFGDVRV